MNPLAPAKPVLRHPRHIGIRMHGEQNPQMWMRLRQFQERWTDSLHPRAKGLAAMGGHQQQPIFVAQRDGQRQWLPLQKVTSQKERIDAGIAGNMRFVVRMTLAQEIVLGLLRGWE